MFAHKQWLEKEGLKKWIRQLAEECFARPAHLRPRYRTKLCQRRGFAKKLLLIPTSNPINIWLLAIGHLSTPQL